jgi:hypothetical protein
MTGPAAVKIGLSEKERSELEARGNERLLRSPAVEVIQHLQAAERILKIRKAPFIRALA